MRNGVRSIMLTAHLCATLHPGKNHIRPYNPHKIIYLLQELWADCCTNEPPEHGHMPDCRAPRRPWHQLMQEAGADPAPLRLLAAREQIQRPAPCGRRASCRGVNAGWAAQSRMQGAGASASGRVGHAFAGASMLARTLQWRIARELTRQEQSTLTTKGSRVQWNADGCIRCRMQTLWS